jgi:uncharacterized protein (DUF2164 family)
MTIEISEQKRREAIASIQQYFLKNMPEEIGNLPAGALLNFILEEIGPAIYNKAIHDAQQRMQARVLEIDSELYVDEFQYWSRLSRKKPSR